MQHYPKLKLGGDTEMRRLENLAKWCMLSLQIWMAHWMTHFHIYEAQQKMPGLCLLYSNKAKKKSDFPIECPLQCALLCTKWIIILKNYYIFTNTVCNILKYTCEYTVVVMTAISLGHLPDINFISSLIVELCLLSSGSHLYKFHWTCTKQNFQQHLLVQCRLGIHHWISLSSNHPQSMTDSLQSPCNLIFFSLGVSDGLRLAFLDGNPISFSWFHTVWSQTLTFFLLFFSLFCFKDIFLWDFSPDTLMSSLVDLYVSLL